MQVIRTRHGLELRLRGARALGSAIIVAIFATMAGCEGALYGGGFGAYAVAHTNAGSSGGDGDAAIALLAAIVIGATFGALAELFKEMKRW
jgi:hypothetical protein